MNKYRNTKAANTTKTYNKLEIEDKTENISEWEKDNPNPADK